MKERRSDFAKDVDALVARGNATKEDAMGLMVDHVNKNSHDFKDLEKRVKEVEARLDELENNINEEKL